MTTFFRNLDAVDSIIYLGASRENASKLVEHLRDPASTAYALNKLDASWLEPLESIGYFRDLSAEGGAVPNGLARSRWSASAYLKRIASYANNDLTLAQTLQRVLAFIPAPGDFYAFRDVVEATVLLPQDMRRSVVPFIQRAIDKGILIEFSNVTQLIKVLAEEGQVPASLRLFTSVFSLFYATSGEDKAEVAVGSDPTSLMDPWHYATELHKCLPALSRVAEIEFLSCLCNLLAKYLQMVSRRPAFPGPDDLSYIWRPAIEEHEQNFRDDIRDALVTAIRDCSTNIVTANAARFATVVGVLDSQQWFVFTRIALYLLSSSPSAPLDLIARYSCEPFLFSEVGVRHEYSLLLKSRFRVLTREQQDAVLKMIDIGPDTQAYARSLRQINKERIAQATLDSYVRRWQYDWLFFISKELPSDWRARFEEFEKEFSTPDHPEFPFYMRSGFVGPDQLLSQTSHDSEDDDKAVEEWIKEYKARELRRDESITDETDNLSERLQNAVQANPQSAIRLIEQLSELPPRFVAVVASALARSGEGFDSNLGSPSLRLSVMVAESLVDTDSVSLREALRNSLSTVLDQLLRDDGETLEAEQVQQLATVCSNLLSTVPSESDQSNLKVSEDFDPLFWAINSTDGRIVENSIKLALRDRKLQGNVDSVDLRWLFLALSRILAEISDDEVRISAILGYRFPWLVHLSKTWATENAEKIFPRSPECRWRWEAAWYSYVAFSGVYNDMLAILNNQYVKAVNEVSADHLFQKSRLKPDQGLAQHLAVYYWRQLVGLHDALLTVFMQKGNREAIRSFLHHIGSGIREVKDLSTDVVQSLRALADWMTSEWKPQHQDANQALSAFGWWFSIDFPGDLSWSLRTLVAVVKKAGSVDNIDHVLTELERVASTEPSTVVDCIEALSEGKPDETARYFLANHCFDILKKANSVADPSTKAKISEIANYFGSLGHFEYRPLA